MECSEGKKTESRLSTYLPKTSIDDTMLCRTLGLMGPIGLLGTSSYRITLTRGPSLPADTARPTTAGVSVRTPLPP